jgi:hypothetical protein
MMSTADSVQLTNGSGIATRTCGEILRVMGGAPMAPGWPSMAELFPGEVGRSKALFNKAIESYLSTGHYLTEADDPTWGHQTLGNLARCVEPLAPFVAKEKAFKISLQTLESQAKELRSQIQSEQKVTDQNVRQSATYWLDSIRMTAKDSDTKAVSCAAKLAKIGDHGANVDITFTVETTTEGKLYATVHNLVAAYLGGVGYIDNPIGGQAP